MIDQQLPKQWSQERIRDAIRFHENQTGADAVLEMETAISEGRAFRTMLIPVEIEDQVLALIRASGSQSMRHSEQLATIVAEERKRYKTSTEA
jgi:hypothetical protein